MLVITEEKPGEGMTYPDLNNSGFQDRFHQIRKELKLTQKVMAEKIGVSLRTLQRYEYGTVSPDAVAFNRLAHLGVDLYWLITGLPFYSPCSNVQTDLIYLFCRRYPLDRNRLLFKHSSQ